MGVPTFFRWLMLRYQRSVVDNRDDLPSFDNFYIDMNGIIHPCCSPDKLNDPNSEEEMFENIKSFLTELVSYVNPGKLLYLAIDGVAPRAKMNQQRARRYRKIQEQKETSSSNEKTFDSNVITPGTEFMCKLGAALHSYIVHMLQGQWKHLNVILSDSNTPGEGEHKILEFIRVQRGLPTYNPNTKHIIHGADADLIMLSLITHEAHFYIIRENMTDPRDIVCKVCGQTGHLDSACTGERKFQMCFVKIPVIREYLAFEFKELRIYPHFDLERIIDDFVFLCFFVGNDFLPNLPSLNIRDGAIDGLIFLYTKIFSKLGGYLTEDGKVVLPKLEFLFVELSRFESEFFLERERRQITGLKRKSEPESSETKTQEEPAKETEEDSNDLLRLGQDGYKARFYFDKFGVTESELPEFITKIQTSYIEGLCWVFEYYYSGCQSWSWFYPFHYAPFASDLCGAQSLRILFTKSRPFPPYAQLLSVFPSESAKFLPECLAKILTDPNTEVGDCFPKNFKLDLNGKRFAWQGVMLLPFIDEKRLMAAYNARVPELTAEEKQRSSIGSTLLYCTIYNPDFYLVFTNIPPLFSHYNIESSSGVKLITVDNPDKNPHFSFALPGVIFPDPEVDENVFKMGDRRGFSAFFFIRLIAKHLRVETAAWMADRQSPYDNFSESYNNNKRIR